MTSPEGHLLELFSSWQGEGPYAGLKQVFVRLSGCHLRCAYCDTPESWERSSAWTLRGESRSNPVTVAETLDAIRSFGPHPSVSLTGGEPVVQAEFVREVALGVRAMGMRTYLDTSGTLAERLAVCADAIDVVAFDIKLPGDELAHTACLGFGLERCVMALFQTHGFDPGGWPDAVRDKLWA